MNITVTFKTNYVVYTFDFTPNRRATRFQFICFLKTKSLDLEIVLVLRTNAENQGETIYLGKH